MALSDGRITVFCSFNRHELTSLDKDKERFMSIARYFAAILTIASFSLPAICGEVYPNQTTPTPLGSGYAPTTNRILSSCVPAANTAFSNPKGSNSSQIKISLIESYQSLADQTSSNASIGAKWGFGGASASISYFKSSKIDSHNVYFHISNRVVKSTEYLASPQLGDGLLSTYRQNPQRFHQVCGTEFIYSASRGGTLDIILRVSTNSREDKRRVTSSLGVNYYGASGSAEFKRKVAEVIKKNSMDFTFVRVGGNKDPVGVPIENLMDYALQFSEQIDESSAVVISVGTRSYSDHIPEFIESSSVIARHEWLAATFKLYDSAIGRTNDVKFAIENPRQFHPFDVNEALKEVKALADYVSSIEETASKCSQQAFDFICPSMNLTLPKQASIKRYDEVIEVAHNMRSPFNKSFPAAMSCLLTDATGYWFFRSDRMQSKDCARVKVVMNELGSFATANFDTHYGDNSGKCTFTFVCMQRQP